MNLPVEDSLKSFLWFHATIFGYIQRYGNSVAYLTGEDRKAFAACLKLVVLDYPSHQVACVMCLAKHHRDISGLGVGTQQMGKKSKSKASREVNDDTVAVEEEKLPSSVKKPMSEVDKTSSAKKRKKPETERGENPPSSAKKPASEIDEIFAAKKKKKTETGKAKKRKENAIEKPEKPKTKKKDKGIRDGGYGDMSSQPKKRRQDGLTVYTEDELGINNADAGNTPLCPFDCTCCF